MKVQGVPFLDFVDLLDKYGYASIESLGSLEPNPMKWGRNQWHFAAELIERGSGFSLKQIGKMKPAQLLQAFNECMRKTGLIIQLTQMKRISESDLIKNLESSWDMEWINRNV